MNKQKDSFHEEVPVAREERLAAPSASKTLQSLFNRHGPLIGADEATSLLGFNTRGAMLRAISQHRLPLELVRPQGRRKSFLATAAVANYLDSLAKGKMEEGTM